MAVNATVERANQARDRAREFERRISAGEDLSDADLTAMNEAVDQAERLYRAAGQADRFRAMDVAASTPGGRVGSSLIGMTDHDGFPMPTTERSSMPHTDPGNTRGGIHGYSVLRALRGAVDVRDGKPFVGLEAEAHQELARHRGGPTKGVLIPWDAPVSRGLFPRDWRFRDLTTTTGAGAVPYLVMPTMIELLRAKLVVHSLGATVMSGMTTGFGLPRQSAATAGYWVAEGVAPTASNAQIDQVEFEPRTAGANTKLTRKFISQSAIAAEDFAVNDLVTTVAQTVEKAALNGAGSGAEPTGILQLSGVPSVTIGATGGALTWLKVLEFIGKLNSANAPLDRRAWLINPQTRAKLGGTPREAGYPKYLYDFDDPASPIAGFPFAETTNMPANLSKSTSGNVLSAAIFGAWSDLVIALFGAVDTIVDPFTESTAGNVRISVLQDVDVSVRHVESFVVCKEIVTT